MNEETEPLQDVKVQALKLEKELLHLIQKFEEKNKVQVVGVHLDSFPAMGRVIKTDSVTVNVDLNHQSIL